MPTPSGWRRNVSWNRPRRWRRRNDSAPTSRLRRASDNVDSVGPWPCCSGWRRAAVYGWQQRRVADERRREAESQRTLALSRQLAARANNEIGRGLQLALLIATAGYRAAPVNDARQMLQRALTAQPQLRTFLSRHHDAVTSVAFSPNGKTLALGARTTQ